MKLSKLDKLAQRAVESWNTKHTTGTKVIVTKDDGDTIKTTTTSDAYVLCGTATIYLKGVGAYDLERVKPIQGEDDE